MTEADDPRKAKTLEEACANGDGTYNALKALSWLSEVLNPGKGLPLSEVGEIAEKVKAHKRDEKRDGKDD